MFACRSSLFSLWKADASAFYRCVFGRALANTAEVCWRKRKKRTITDRHVFMYKSFFIALNTRRFSTVFPRKTDLTLYNATHKIQFRLYIDRACSNVNQKLNLTFD